VGLFLYICIKEMIRQYQDRNKLNYLLIKTFKAMKPSNTATAVANTATNSKTNLSVVPTKDKEKKFTKDVQAETVTPIDKTEAPKEVAEPKKQLSIEELKNKAIALEALTDKHNAIIEKTQELDKFKVLHEESQARIRIEDVNGLFFESTNPKTIAQVIQIWKENFAEAKANIEDKIRQVYSE
jgi:precorrin-6B methylase 1